MVLLDQCGCVVGLCVGMMFGGVDCCWGRRRGRGGFRMWAVKQEIWPRL